MQHLIIPFFLISVTSLSVQADNTPNTIKNTQQHMEVITVKGNKQSKYQVKPDDSATFVPGDYQALPFNVGVINREQWQVRQLDNLSDALVLNASISRSQEHSRNNSLFNIRGFRMDASKGGFLINGMPVTTAFAQPAHLSAIAVTEVLKGTSSLFFGANSPAGVVNYVYKTPSEHTQSALSLTFGQNNTYKGEIDLTGPLSDTINYRFTLAAQDSKGFAKYDYLKDVAPTLQLQWQATADTKIRVIAEHLTHKSNPISVDTLFVDGEFIEGPKDQYFGFSTDFETQTNEGLQFHVDHALNNQANIKLQFSDKTNGIEQGISGYMLDLPFALPNLYDPKNGIYLRSTSAIKSSVDSQYAAAHLNWHLQTSNIEHQVLFGANYSKSLSNHHSQFSGMLDSLPALLQGDFSVLSNLPPSLNINDIQNPAYRYPNNYHESPPFGLLTTERKNAGINMQNAMHFTDHGLKVLIGARYASFDSQYINFTDNKGQIHHRQGLSTTKSKWLSRLGLVYDLNPQSNLFVSYGESFNPPLTSAKDIHGNILDKPEQGEQYEVGMRGNLLNGDINASISLFQLRNSNVLVNTGIPKVFELAGEQTSNGVELDFSGKLNNYVTTTFSYAYTDISTTKDKDGNKVSGQLNGVPYHRAILDNHVSLDWIGLNGLSFAYSIDYQSATNIGTFDLATFTNQTVKHKAIGAIHNINLIYEPAKHLNNLKFNLGISNLTDKFYVKETSTTMFAKRGQPRHVLLTMSMNF